jgi:hypothetical protein
MVSDNGVGIPADALAAITARLREGINRREGPEQVASAWRSTTSTPASSWSTASGTA